MRLAIRVLAATITVSAVNIAQIGQPYPGGGGQYPQGGQYPGGGGYPPGGQYPGGGYPGGGQGTGLPFPKIKFPRRKPKEEQADTQKVKLAGVEGRLRKLGEKDLYLETGKNDVLRFRLVTKTQFHKKSGEVMRDSLLNPGDRISVQVEPGDEETALLVTFLEAGGQSERAAADQPIKEASVRAPRAEDLGKAKTVALGGGGGGAATESSESGGETSSSPASSTAEAAVTPAETSSAGSKPLDASDKIILDSAREAALKYSATLPDFVAQQNTNRFFSTRSGGDWQPLDVVTAEVVYLRGREEYRNVQIDGRPSTRPIEKTGAWSTGEFGTVLEGLMAGDAQAQFRRRPGVARAAANRQAWVFDVSVPAAHSSWVLVSPDGREHQAAYSGAVWIDQETRRVLRIERRALSLPADFALSKVASTLDYAYVRIDQTNYLLPFGGETMSCANGGSCSRNVIEFRGIRKFGAESTVKF